MSRQEDFIDAGIAYRMEHSKPMCIAGSNLADVERDFNRVKPFEAGAEHGYQYAVDKACEWLKNHSETDYYELIPNANYCGAVELNKNKIQHATGLVSMYRPTTVNPDCEFFIEMKD